MNGTICPFGSARCTPLITPADTLDSKPNGEPIAITHSPRLIAGLALRSSAGRFVASILISAMSVRLSLPIDLGRELAAVGELDRDFGGAVDHVRVGDDVAVRAHDEARAQAAHLRLRCGTAARAVGNAEALEELAVGAVLVVSSSASGMRLHALLAARHHADVDDRRTGALDERREVGKIRRGVAATAGATRPQARWPPARCPARGCRNASSPSPRRRRRRRRSMRR